MTALSVAARPHEDATLRPVPWRRMVWVTWRQHRIALLAAAAFLGALAVWLRIAGLQLHQAYATAGGCHPLNSPDCSVLGETFNGMNGFLSNGYVLQAVPALLGAFVGAPVLARELESGTFRYAWTQGFGRWRWTLAKLVPLAVLLAVTTGVFSLPFSWYYQPYFAPGNQRLLLATLSPINDGLFELRGIAFGAWTLAAFAIGAMAGVLIRRVVPAIAATLAVYTGLAVAAVLFLRHHYLTPLISTKLTVPGSPLVIAQWWTKGGKTIDQATMYRVITATLDRLHPVLHSRSEKFPDYLSMERYLNAHGYTQWTRYQPSSRFWPFQWIEGGWLLVLSVLLIAATVWLVRRRAA